MNVQSWVPKSPCCQFAGHLEKEWSWIIKWAAWGFLAALRSYHRSYTHHLRLQAANLESSIVACLGRTNAITTGNTANKSVYDTCKWDHRLWEWHKKKLHKLLPLDSQIEKIAYNQSKQRQRRLSRKAASTRMTSDPEVPSTVLNLSRITLSEVQTKLLSRGLSFSPTLCDINKEEKLDDLESYFRRLRLK